MSLALENLARPPVHAVVRIVREPRLVERVVFVGGQPGCGKSLMTWLIGSFAGVEIQKYHYLIEHLCSLDVVGQHGHANRRR